MSYVRCGDDSDVYVIGSVSGYLECCGCPLYKYSYQTKRYSRMLEHLQEHKDKWQDKVPARAFNRLRAEMREEGPAFTVDTPQVTTAKLRNFRQPREKILYHKFHRAMTKHTKAFAKTTLEVFEKVMGREPTLMEIEGVAKAADVSMDLHWSRLG